MLPSLYLHPPQPPFAPARPMDLLSCPHATRLIRTNRTSRWKPAPPVTTIPCHEQRKASRLVVAPSGTRRLSQGSLATEVLSRSGWARSVGGSGPYISLFARSGLSRTAIDAAVANLAIHELPSARGCTYVLPAEDFALGLRLAQNFAGSEMKLAEKLGVTAKEIDKLCDAILSALKNGPLDPQEIRDATGVASRSLGPEGKKKGLTTTLPVALERLQVAGEIRRVPTNGRLDQQRYRYALWRPNPLAKSKLSFEEAAVELARRYFRWIGPATPAEFQQFAALGVKASKAAIDALQLVPAENGSDRLLFGDDRDAWNDFAAPKAPNYTLVSSVDSMVLLRREFASLLDPQDSKRKVPTEKGTAVAGGLKDLETHVILDRGRIVGLWEYDPASESIAWTSFIPADKALKAAIATTETFVRDELGDMRAFSLDSPASRAPRVAELRKMHAATGK